MSTLGKKIQHNYPIDIDYQRKIAALLALTENGSRATFQETEFAKLANCNVTSVPAFLGRLKGIGALNWTRVGPNTLNVWDVNRTNVADWPNQIRERDTQQRTTLQLVRQMMQNAADNAEPEKTPEAPQPPKDMSPILRTLQTAQAFLNAAVDDFANVERAFRALEWMRDHGLDSLLD